MEETAPFPHKSAFSTASLPDPPDDRYIGFPSLPKNAWKQSKLRAKSFMATIRLPPDFKEFLRLLNEKQVEYLLIGVFAGGNHGYPRATVGMDIWVSIPPNRPNRRFAVRRKLTLERLRVYPRSKQGRPYRVDLDNNSVYPYSLSRVDPFNPQTASTPLSTAFIHWNKAGENSPQNAAQPGLNFLQKSHVPPPLRYNRGAWGSPDSDHAGG